MSLKTICLILLILMEFSPVVTNSTDEKDTHFQDRQP